MMRDEPIRPGIWALALTTLGAVVAALWLALSPGGESDVWIGAENAENDDYSDAGPPEHILGPDLSGELGGGLVRQAYGGGPSIAEDPQLQAMFRTVGGMDAGVAAFPPTTYPARLTSVDGWGSVSAGQPCDVRVLPVRSSAFNCLVRVMCGGVVLYPDGEQNAGYAPCDVRDGVPTRAVDQSTTHQDGDPTIDVDLVARRVRVTDEFEGHHFEAELVLEVPL